ncbi:MAG TPA: hypothetical protein PKV93_11990 [Fervidobacterium sp.]|nr:hypothetical protein [Fervidobacterium sp.]
MKKGVSGIIDQLNEKLDHVPSGLLRSFTIRKDDRNNIVVRIYDPGVTRVKIATTIIYESGCAGYLRDVDDEKNWIEFTVFVGRYR